MLPSKSTAATQRGYLIRLRSLRRGRLLRSAPAGRRGAGRRARLERRRPRRGARLRRRLLRDAGRSFQRPELASRLILTDILTGVLTPTADVLSLLWLWLPLVGLYELGIVLCRWAGGGEVVAAVD